MRFRVALGLVLCLLTIVPAIADDFLSDLAACAKAPISAASFALSQSRKAAEFVANHGECVPMVVSGDALLYGMSGGVAALQAGGTLPSGTEACVDATLGKASQPVASLLTKFMHAPPMATLIPSAGKIQIEQIANGQSKAALYEVEGIGLVMSHMTCSCAVASTAIDIGELKQQIKNVVESVEGCKNVAGKLLGGAYSVAKGAYGGAKDAVNSVGCTLHLGGCSSGPPFFCTGYIAARDQGTSQAALGALFPSVFDPQYIQSHIQSCEGQYATLVAARQKKAAEAAEAKLLAQEMEKAQKLGAANGLGFAFRWSPKCLDDICKASIAKFADAYTKDIQDPETIKYYKTFSLAIPAMEKKYGALAQVAVGLSRDRHDKALRADVHAPPGERLSAFGCHLFLGRAQQSLCDDAAGFDVCRGYVDADVWMSCALSGTSGAYTTRRALGRFLRDAGCIPEAERMRDGPGAGPARGRGATLIVQCLSGLARARCDSLGKMKYPIAVACQGPLDSASFDRSRLERSQPMQPVAPQRVRPIEVVPPVTIAPTGPRPFRPVAPQTSTICRFDAGPRAGQIQDYAPMAPLPVGTPCHDGRGSTGVVVAP